MLLSIGSLILLIVSVFERFTFPAFSSAWRGARPDEQFCDTITGRDERDSRRYFALLDGATEEMVSRRCKAVLVGSLAT